MRSLTVALVLVALVLGPLIGFQAGLKATRSSDKVWPMLFSGESYTNCKHDFSIGKDGRITLDPRAPKHLSPVTIVYPGDYLLINSEWTKSGWVRVTNDDILPIGPPKRSN
jgi:hypothetical protein